MAAATATALILGGMAAYQAYSQSEAQKAQGAYQKAQADTNAMFADAQAQDAKERGQYDALVRGRETRKLMGAQRAASAAGGVDPTSGSAADIMAETDILGRQDQLTIKNNAWREAWGYKTQARDYRSQGELAKMGADNMSRDTLLAGGIRAFDYGSRGFSKRSNVDVSGYDGGSGRTPRRSK